MLTNNMSSYLRFVNGVSMDGNACSFTQTTGAGLNTAPGCAYSYYNQSVGNNGGIYVDVGFGDTAPALTDYKLADSNAVDTPTLTHVSGSFLNDFPYIRSAISIYRNDTSSDVTVKEIGLCSKTQTASNPARTALLARTVLPEPVVIAPGETYSFTYSVEA